MALIIETGEIVDGANSYVEVVEFEQYLSDRGYSLAGASEPLLIRSFDYMQGLTWCDDHASAYAVTQNMKNAQCEIAYRMDQGFDPAKVVPAQNVKREKVDVLETEYFEGGGVSATFDESIIHLAQAYSYIKDLLCFDSGGSAGIILS